MAAGYLSESRPPRWPTGNAHVPQTHRTAPVKGCNRAGRVAAGALFWLRLRRPHLSRNLSIKLACVRHCLIHEGRPRTGTAPPNSNV